jgi:hypothetical protein
MKSEIRKQVEHLVLTPGAEDMARGARSVLVKAVASAIWRGAQVRGGQGLALLICWKYLF